jgi:S1-C subfamily serine protease
MNEPAPTSGFTWPPRLARLGARARRAAPFALGVLAAFAALLFFNLLFPGSPPLTPQQVSDAVAQAMASATAPPAISARAYAAVQPALVLIEARGPGAGEAGEGNGVGSGVIVNADGDILTALHVVSGAVEIALTFFDGTQAAARLASAEPENDIAVLAPSHLPAQAAPAILGNPNALRVGDEAFVMGNPFGLYSSLSAGVISGFNRSIVLPDGEVELDGLIQVDAAVNPGNSGGPLVNRAGQVVGIVTALVNPTEQEFFIGIGFAVPIDVAGAAAGAPLY